MEKLAESRRVASHDISKVADVFALGEEQAEHAAYLIGGQRYPGGLGPLLHTGDECFTLVIQCFEETRGGNQFQCFQSRGHGYRIAGEGAGLIDGAIRRDLVHDVRTAAKSAHRHAAADDFA